MQCPVCQMSSEGSHYTVFCCRACASFFRRTILKKLRYRCEKEGNCDITLRSRFSCRYCRLKKCVAVGMITNIPSTLIDFHFDSICEKSELETHEVHDFYSISNVFGDNETFFQHFSKRIEIILKMETRKTRNSYKLPLCKQISIEYNNLMKKWPNCRKEKLDFAGIPKFTQYMCDYFKGLEQAADFCMSIDPFLDLPFDQKSIVFTNFIMKFPQMVRIFTTVDCLGHDVTDSRLVNLHGMPLDIYKSDLFLSEITDFPTEEIRRVIISTTSVVHRFFLHPFKRLFADDFERSYLIAYVMWYLEGIEGLSAETLKISNDIRLKISEELFIHYKIKRKIKNFASRIYKLHNIVAALDRIAEMRARDRHMFNTFKLFKIPLRIWQPDGGK